MTWLRDHLRTAPRPEPAAARQAWPVEVGETDGAVIVTVPLRGLKPNDVAVSLRDRVLVITLHGRVIRSIRLPAAVDPVGVTATIVGEMLTITLPRAP